MNPYKHLASQARALWKLESSLPPEEREKISCVLRIEVAKRSVSLIKGGPNTFVLKLDGTEDIIDYPNPILARIDKLGRQRHIAYLVKTPKGKRFFWEYAKAAEVKPLPKSCIVGLNSDGTTEIAYKAVKNIKGHWTWISANKEKQHE